MITQQQQQILNGYTCQRMRDDPDNRTLIQTLSAQKNPLMVQTIKQRAWSSDYKGTIAYYVVKDAAGALTMVFSLRCGLLCEPGYIHRIAGLLDETKTLRRALMGAAENDPYWIEYLDNQKERLGPEELDRRIAHLNDHLQNKLSVIKTAEADRRKLPDQDVVRVDEIHSAVELVELCVNDTARDGWDKDLMGGRRLGTTLFWQFVVPKMLAVSETAGCEYAYLYAAGKRGERLVRIYAEDFRFIEPKHLGAVKPGYDSNCLLMIKKLFTAKAGEAGELGLLEPDPDYLGLDRHRTKFFQNFNNSPVN